MSHSPSYKLLGHFPTGSPNAPKENVGTYSKYSVFGTLTTKPEYNQRLVLSVIDSLCYGDSIDLTLADEDLTYLIHLSTDRSKTVEERMLGKALESPC